jgi:hypothetical protein
MAQFLGILDASWRQEALDPEKGGKVKVGGIKNNLVKTGRRVGRAQEFEESEITMSIPLERARQLKKLFDAGEGELIVKCDTGQTYTWPDAFLVNRPEFTGGEGGKVELKWNAGEPEELVS